jgi:hypothetical protein
MYVPNEPGKLQSLSQCHQTLLQRKMCRRRRGHCEVSDEGCLSDLKSCCRPDVTRKGNERLLDVCG